MIPGEVAESIENDNIPYFTEQEKYNEAITSSVKRISSTVRASSRVEFVDLRIE